MIQQATDELRTLQMELSTGQVSVSVYTQKLAPKWLMSFERILKHQQQQHQHHCYFLGEETLNPFVDFAVYDVIAAHLELIGETALDECPCLKVTLSPSLLLSHARTHSLTH